MALKAWYPLVNGLYKNQGASIPGDLYSNIELNHMDVPAKLGTSSVRADIKWSDKKTASIFNNNELSIAFWIYNKCVGDSFNSGITQPIFGNNTSLSSRRFTLFQYDKPWRLHYSWTNSDGSTVCSGTLNNGIIAPQQWTHISVTYKYPQMRIYVNGESKTLVDDIRMSTSDFTQETQVAYKNDNHILNDLRVYNHCLSAYEVHELAKGLCCHYSFDGWYPNNVVTDLTKCKHSTSNTSIQKLTSNTYKFRPTIDSPQSDRYGYLYWTETPANEGAAILKEDTYYSFNCEVFNASESADINIKFEGGVDLSTVTSNYGVTNSSGPTITVSEKNKWVQINGSFKTGLYKNSGSSGNYRYGSDWIMFYPDPNQSKFYDGYQLYRNVTLYENPEYYPSDITNNINDNSGFNNNAETHNIKNYSKGKIGNKSLVFDGKYTYIQLPKTCKLTDAFTYNIWAYMKDWNEYGNGGGRIISCTDSGGYNIEAPGANIVFAFYSGTDKQYTNNIQTDTVNSLGTDSWHMFSFSLDVRNNIVKAYIDGIPVETEFTDNKFVGEFSYNKNNTIYLGAEASYSSAAGYEGPFFTGKLDDFRLYGTVLSDEDIKDLYNCRAIVDNRHNLYVSSIKEDTNTAFVDETSSLEYSHLSEINYTSNISKELLEMNNFKER